MKRIRPILMLSLMCGLFFSPVLMLAQGQHVTVRAKSNDGFVNIRQTPVAGSPILGRLRVGSQRLPYTGTTSQWHRVQYNGSEGYVSARYSEVLGLEQWSLQRAGAGTLYYVVIDSSDNLDDMHKALYTLPDALDGASIFRDQADVGTRYLLCTAIYRDKVQAEEAMLAIRQMFFSEVQVYESSALPCVAAGIYPNGDMNDLTPQ